MLMLLLMLRHVMLSHLMPCHAMSCHAMPCHVMPCHAMSCHVMYIYIYNCLQWPKWSQMVSRELARLRASCVWNPPSKCHSQHQLGLSENGVGMVGAPILSIFVVSPFYWFRLGAFSLQQMYSYSERWWSLWDTGIVSPFSVKPICT